MPAPSTTRRRSTTVTSLVPIVVLATVMIESASAANTDDPGFPSLRGSSTARNPAAVARAPGEHAIIAA